MPNEKKIITLTWEVTGKLYEKTEKKLKIKIVKKRLKKIRFEDLLKDLNLRE